MQSQGPAHSGASVTRNASLQCFSKDTPAYVLTFSQSHHQSQEGLDLKKWELWGSWEKGPLGLDFISPKCPVSLWFCLLNARQSQSGLGSQPTRPRSYRTIKIPINCWPCWVHLLLESSPFHFSQTEETFWQGVRFQTEMSAKGSRGQGLSKLKSIYALGKNSYGIQWSGGSIC